MRISIIVAMDGNRLIGANNELPWHLSADLKRFKRLTMGRPLIMGRKTHESLGRALPGRRNIVVTAQADYTPAPGCIIAHSLDEALAAAAGVEQVFVIGGAALYTEAVSRADAIYLTRVDGDYDGDTWFPDIDWRQWREVAREDHAAADGTPAHSFIELERQSRP